MLGFWSVYTQPPSFHVLRGTFLESRPAKRHIHRLLTTIIGYLRSRVPWPCTSPPAPVIPQRYDGIMRCPAAGLFRALILVAGVCSGQIPQPPTSPSHYIEIKLPPGVISESVFVRYLLAGEEFGGWVQPHPGASSYFISTSHEGRSATRIRALLYAPGCAIQTLDLPVSGSNSRQYSFICRPLASVWIVGTLTRADRLYRREIKLQAKYVARWAQSFLGLGDSIVTSIPVGDVTYLSPDGRFSLSVPNFSQDPLAGAPDHLGELQIWARDKTSGDVVAQLIPTGPQVIRTRMGGLKIQTEYPSETIYAPCAANPPQVHDAIGFALRPGASDACDR